MDAVDVDAQEGVRDVAVTEPGGIGEDDGDQQCREGEGDGEADGAEACVDVVRVDDVVAVAVPEEDVSLQGG